MAERITLADLLDSVNLPAQALDGGFTRTDLEESTGLSRPRASEILGEWVKAGKVKCVGKRPAVRVDGARYRIPVYKPCPSSSS